MDMYILNLVKAFPLINLTNNKVEPEEDYNIQII